jgi:hypothetical protein
MGWTNSKIGKTGKNTKFSRENFRKNQGRSRDRWDANIKMDLWGVGRGDVD